MRKLAMVLLATFALAANFAFANVVLTPVASYETGIFDEGATEIAAFDPVTDRVFSVNGFTGSIDVVDLSDPGAPTFLFTIDVTPWGAGANHVSWHDGVLAAAVEADIKQDPGRVVFFDADGNHLNDLPAGALPDMCMFTPDGNYLLVACEGEPDDDYLVDPEGSVTIINLINGVALATANQVSFAGFNGQIDDLRAAGVRIYGPGATVAQDLEPEYIAYNPLSGVAYVNCQEANALVLVDVAAATATAVLPLGFKDHSLPGNGLDASDRDDMINIANWPVWGMYQPDGMVGYLTCDAFYLITANEGDSRDYDGYSEEERIKDLDLDPVAFPDAEALQENEAIGRLGTTTANGDMDGDGDYDVLYANGARSFAIWDEAGNLVFDSGDQFEQILANLIPTYFNSSNDDNDDFDSRSDAKGPEPEGVAVASIGGTCYAVIGMERVGGLFLYDVTDPTTPIFLQYVSTRNWAGDPEDGTAGGLGPEGILYIPAEDSPVGQALILSSNEVSGNIDVFLLDELTVGIEDRPEENPAVDGLPVATRLSNVYPNPFNPTTTIKFAVSSEMPVKLEVLDVRGRLVETLVDGVKGAGEHGITWTANGQASGVYFARLQSRDGVEVRRLTLVK